MANHPDRFLFATFGGSAPRPGLTEQFVKERYECFRKLSLTQQASDPQDYAALAASLQAASIRELATEEQLRAVDVPALGIVGSDDANMDALKAPKGVLRSFELVVIDGATHGTKKINSPEFLESLAAFIPAHSIDN